MAAPPGPPRRARRQRAAARCELERRVGRRHRLLKSLDDAAALFVDRHAVPRRGAARSVIVIHIIVVAHAALGEGDDASLGIDARSKVEARLRQLEGGSVRASAPNGAPKKLIEVVQSGNGAAGYSAASDMVLEKKEKKKKKRDREELSPDEAAAKKARKAEKKARKLAEAAAAGGDGEKPKKKKKKSKD